MDSNLSLVNYFIYPLILLITSISECAKFGEVIYAVNAGGDSHVDIFGIEYDRDPLHNKVGTASDYGKQLIIGRVPQNDQILYQTERYHHSTFGYDIPIEEDGQYVMVLKFCEVYFNAPNMKVSTLSFSIFSYGLNINLGFIRSKFYQFNSLVHLRSDCCMMHCFDNVKNQGGPLVF